ncbi:hypothetical protein AX16_009415 [Volvariella volvacea WC 439]|nr:hypothetical protein AX16_009415 [Volvariella volvacea WC 439]
MSETRTNLTEEQIQSAFDKLGGLAGYEKFLNKPKPRDGASMRQYKHHVDVEGTIMPLRNAKGTATDKLGYVTITVLDGKHSGDGVALIHRNKDQPTVIRFTGTLYYDQWRVLESSPNRFETDANGSVHQWFYIGDSLIAEMVGTTTDVVGEWTYADGDEFNWTSSD